MKHIIGYTTLVVGLMSMLLADRCMAGSLDFLGEIKLIDPAVEKMKIEMGKKVEAARQELEAKTTAATRAYYSSYYTDKNAAVIEVARNLCNKHCRDAQQAYADAINAAFTRLSEEHARLTRETVAGYDKKIALLDGATEEVETQKKKKEEFVERTKEESNQIRTEWNLWKLRLELASRREEIPKAGGTVTQMVFVCNFNGSGELFELLKEELVKAVGRFRPEQSFDIALSNNKSFDALSVNTKSGELLKVTPENKQKAMSFLRDAKPGLDSNPIPALRHAFKLQPQLIYLLTDGAFTDNKKVMEEINKLNVDRKVRVNAIAFLRGNIDRRDKILCEEVLSMIARDNGGNFTIRYTFELINKDK